MDNESPKSVMFKPVAGGWVYRAPNPWVFGDAPHYLVNDAQKAQIEAIVIPRRPVLFGAMLVAGIVAWVFALVGIVWVVSRHDDPSTTDVIAIAVLVAISLVAALPFAGWIQRRRLQPILAGLPLTQERITLADMRKNARTATPFKQSRNAFIASVFASFAAVAAAYSHYAAKPGLDAQLIIWTFNAVLWGSLAFVWYGRALRKASETSTEAAKQDSARFVQLSRIVLLIAVSGLVVLVAGLQVLRKHSVPTAPDYAKARVQYEAGAKAGDAKAMNGLGWLYQSGLGGAQDYGKAKEWFEKAAAAGDGRAMSNLGTLYQNGFGVPQDYTRTREWFEKAAAVGNSAGMNNLGWLYQMGFGITQDYAKAKEWYEKAAILGEGAAMNSIGWLYQNGLGVTQDYAKAREWYEKAIAARNSAAMNNLGWLCQNGRGGPQDYAKAREWFEKSAAAGNSSGMNSLGWLYQNGLGVKQDYAKAREWYEKAANASNVAGMSNLAWLYQNGWGIPQDYAKARELNEKAAAGGIGFSMDALGAMYVNGWGVPKSDVMAREWYEKASAAGNVVGMQHLASMLDASKGGSADAARAAHLLLQSAKLGHKWSVTVLEGPLTFLTPATRIELKREFARLGHYNGTIDDVWDETARAAATAYLDASH